MHFFTKFGLLVTIVLGFSVYGCNGTDGTSCGDCSDQIDCTTDYCDPDTTTCMHDPDDTLCGAGQRCDAVLGCVDVPPCSSDAECDDDNPCTDDRCDPQQGCVNTNNTTACDDGNRCSESDACANGTCSGTPLDCDDGNLCTDDSCDPASGCQYANNTIACDDGNPCTLGDACQDGQCAGGTNTCACEQDGDCAQHEDGDLCNGTLICVDNFCVVDANTVVVCDPGGNTDCQENLCVPETGACVMTDRADGTLCDDGDACTSSDACAGGTCTGSPTDCDDADACTTDGCDSASGCAHSAVDCDDNDLCTTDACDPASGCVNTAVDCDDSDACTTDTCDPATGCGYTAVDCDDSDLCTNDSCDPATGCVNAIVNCDDSNLCTSDSCNPATGCAHISVDCNDGNACTIDTCGPTVGCEYTLDNCRDANPCTIDACDPATGCYHPPVNCDDGDVCTNDYCSGGCQHNWIPECCHDDTDCDDGVACTTNFCETSNNTCQYPPVDSACDDLDPCTDDVCNPSGGCENPDKCDDGLLCTLDYCEPFLGICSNPPTGCVDGDACTADSCDEVNGCQNPAIDCDDGIACTLNDCDSGSGCLNTPDDNQCDDGDPCTVNICDQDEGCIFPCDSSNAACNCGQPNLFFSEYVEGSSWNKALEIFNAEADPVLLGNCAVEVYFNGNPVPDIIPLDPVALGPSKTHVLCHPNISDPSLCDQMHGRVDFNGDDAVVLACGGSPLDLIGEPGLGVNVPPFWGLPPEYTADRTLRRICIVTHGSLIPMPVMDFLDEWGSYGQDTLEGLGQHAVGDCCRPGFPADFCDDGIGCTNDSCAMDESMRDGHCLSVPDDSACDDSDECTVDTCDSGVGGCVNADITDSCDLGDPCYTYGCDPATGCTEFYVCDDGDPCTEDIGCGTSGDPCFHYIEDFGNCFQGGEIDCIGHELCLPNLVFSKYVEGSEGPGVLNKALEVTNASFMPLFASQCAIFIHVDADPSNVVIIPIDVELWPGEIWVVCNDTVSFGRYCDVLTSDLLFDGNDALELICIWDDTGGGPINRDIVMITTDVIGQIGVPPPAGYWGTEPVTTQNHSLIRDCRAIMGDDDGFDPFDPALQWLAYPIDTVEWTATDPNWMLDEMHCMGPVD